MSYKLIRELTAFQKDEDISTSDYLIAASNPDGTPAQETFKMTIKDVVSEYNREIAVEQAEKAASGDSLLGGTFSEIEVIDGKEVMIDATPITAANIDTLVDPGSGLEVIEICYDITKQQVPCTINGLPNPAVKYKQKKLSFAKSGSSRSITIQINDNEGIEYSGNEGQFKVNSSGSFDTKFKYLQDAYNYINSEIVSADMTINIFIETDLNEPWFYGNGYMTTLKFRKINIYGAQAQDINLKKIYIKHGVGRTLVDPSKFNGEDLNEAKRQWNYRTQFRHGQYRPNPTDANPNPVDQDTLPDGIILQIHACCPFWIGSNTYWRGIHFVMEFHGESIFTAYRQVGSQVHFAQCKFSAKSYPRPDINNGIPATSATLAGVRQFFDIRDGSTMHVQNVSDGSSFEDYSGIEWKGIDTSGLELDLAGISYMNNVFLIEKGSELKIIEYQAGSHASSGQAARTMPSRLTITSAVNAFCFFQMVNGSAVTANAPIVAANDLTGADINVTHALKAEGFNTIRMWGYSDENGLGKDHVIPGATFAAAGTAANVDYRNTSNVLSGTDTLKFYPKYYDNFTAWPAY